jgi:hypothetical protein
VLVRASFALALALVFSPLAAADKNLLVNSDFSQASQLSGWTGTGSWSNNDAGNAAGSGSLMLTAATVCIPPTPPIPTPICAYYGSSSTSSCMMVRPGAAYALGGQYVIAGAFPAPLLACAAHSNADCTGAGVALGQPALSLSYTWSAAVTASGTLPGDAQSVSCTASLDDYSPLTDGTSSANFDNLFFTTDVIFSDAFE